MAYANVVLSGLVLCVTVAGCSMPATSRTAVIKDITIAEDLNPDNVLIHAGDEVRWVNLRKDRVQLDIPNLGDRDLSCRRGFSNWIGHVRESVAMKPNESVSLCFEDQGLINYNVRAETAMPGGKQLLSGSVRVAGRYQ